MTDQTQSQPYPRLSTHILLGDHLRERNPQQWLTANGGCGCALGGAMISAGVWSLERRMSSEDIRAVWPWLDKLPPKDWWYRGPGDWGWGCMNFTMLISRRFWDVFRGDLTIEALADQVREWEEEYDDDLRASLSLSLSLSSSDPADNLRQGAGDLAAGGESSALSELVRSAS